MVVARGPPTLPQPSAQLPEGWGPGGGVGRVRERKGGRGSPAAAA